MMILKLKILDASVNNKNGKINIKKVSSDLIKGKELVLESNFSNDTLFVNSNYTSSSNNLNN